MIRPRACAHTRAHRNGAGRRCTGELYTTRGEEYGWGWRERLVKMPMFFPTNKNKGNRQVGDFRPGRKVGKSQMAQFSEGFLFGTILSLWVSCSCFAVCRLFSAIPIDLSLILASPSFPSILGGFTPVLPNSHTLRLEGLHLSSNPILSKCSTVTTRCEVHFIP